MKYDANDPRITAYLFDELEADERANFERDLQQSGELRQLVDETRTAISALKSELDADDSPLLTEANRQVIRSQLADSTPDSGPGKESARSARPGGRRIRWIGLGAVAASLFALLISYYPSARSHFQRQLAQSQAQTTYPQKQFSHAQRQLAESQAQTARGASDASDKLTAAATQTTELYTFSDVEDVQNEMKEFDFVSPRVVQSAVRLNKRGKPERFGKYDVRIERGHVSKKFADPRGNHKANEAFVAAGRVTSEAELAPHPDSSDEGRGPGWGGDKHDLLVENEFSRVSASPLSTFSIDVDTAAYSKVRMYLAEHRQLPRPDAVRIEELINYFPYSYEGPVEDVPFAAHLAVASCPWKPEHQLVRIALKGKEIEYDQRPASNLVFLLDVSGSMDQPNKLPLLKRGMKMLIDQLGENDRVAIVVYAGAAGMVLDSTVCADKATIVTALERLHAGGSTNGGAGIQLAYQTALDNFIAGGVNRVILCTDGDFNVGTTGTDELVRVIQQHARDDVFLSVLGFGMGNHNDSMLEQISNKGNGNYAFVDNENEARKVLVEQTSGTLVTLAKDVKVQVEFNPLKVAAYRLVGYENRVLAAQDFNDDKKDAGEIGAGHTVTALYEIVPAGANVDVPAVDPLKYQSPAKANEAARRDELLTVKLRYKQPDGDTSKLLSFPLADEVLSFNRADRDFQFAAAVASFGMLLRDSEFKGDATFASVRETAEAAADGDSSGYRHEFLELVRIAGQLAGEVAVGEDDAADR